jgi:hypothetical protein
MAGRYSVRLSLTLDEIRTIVKSLSIGADQVGKKLDRVRGTYRAVDVLGEYQILTHTKLHFERLLTEIVDKEMEDEKQNEVHP